MQPRPKYYIAPEMQMMCATLGITPGNVLRSAGLPADYFDADDPGMTPHQMFGLWGAAAQEYGHPDLALRLGQMLARGKTGPLILAFTCSHTVAEGFDRIALFKPLAGPFQLTTQRTDEAFTVSMKSSIPSLPLPALIAAMDVVFFVELVRATTGENLIPLQATVPCKIAGCKDIEALIGCSVDQSDAITVSFALYVADLPLVTENAHLWAYYEKDLQRKLDAQHRDTPTSDRLRASLHKLLPSGKHTAEDASRRLGLSKRTLQRQLTAEGTTYQKVLDTTRSELSLHYLRKHNMSVEEISYLLAYRDPNSFYRAFHSWTGMTPAQARG